MQKLDTPPPTPASAADPFIGKTIGNCRIVEKINEGGTSLIYRGHNPRFGLDRVVKILKPSLIGEEDFYHRFVQEAQLTARLDHPNILRVFDTGEVDGYFYIEMEHIAGKTLREYIAANPKMAEREMLAIASQVARALDYAHRAQITAPDSEQIQGILHRDIKPENIMITPGKLVKLMDFGAAKPLNITSNTMQGMIVGTFHYMSPEQLKGDKLDTRSDFFSLGVVMYEMCTGQKPFCADNLTELIEKITTCKYPRLHTVRSTISPRTVELIEKLLSRNRDHRYSTAQEIDEDIQICLQTLSSWGLGQKAKVPFSLRRAFPGLALIFSSLALALSAYAFLRVWRMPSSPSISSSNTVEAVKTVTPITGATILEKAKGLEAKRMWREAVGMFEMVPSSKDGGVAAEYLEAQIRAAMISMRQFRELTKARSMLEKLRMDYSDPAIDAYLGRIYFDLALYSEARTRYESALSSKTSSVIPQTLEFRSEMLYYYANSLDRQYTYLDKNQALLMESIKAWKYFVEFSECKSKPSKDCSFAAKRIEELEKKDREINRPAVR